MSEWQTIESAEPNEKLLLGWWEFGEWQLEFAYAVVGAPWNARRHMYATHWQPLPAPPEEPSP